MRQLDPTNLRAQGGQALGETVDIEADIALRQAKESASRDDWDCWEVVDHETGETFVVDSYEEMYETCEGTDYCAYGFDEDGR